MFSGKLPGFLIAFLGIPNLFFAQISAGDSQTEVKEALGEPAGFVEISNQTVYIFERGSVTFRDGRVVSHSLISEEELQKRREKTEKQEQDRLAQAKALLEQIQQNPELAGKTGTERKIFWETFHQRFPEIDVSFERAVAAKQILAEKEERAHDFELHLQETMKIAALLKNDALIETPFGYYGGGFPFFFDQNFFRSFSRNKSIDHRFPIRRPPELPPTPREKAMPLQQFDFGRAQFNQGHGRQHGGSGHGKSRNSSRHR